MRLRYVKENGLSGYYYPDFLVRTKEAIFLAETKAQTMLPLPDIKRKRKAAIAWCDKINELTEDQRSGKVWGYALIGESLFYEFRRKGASSEAIS